MHNSAQWNVVIPSCEPDVLSREAGQGASTRCSLSFYFTRLYPGKVDRPLFSASGRGRAVETLARNPPPFLRVFPPRQRPCPNGRVAQLYRRVQPRDGRQSLTVGHPLHPPRGMPRGAHLAGQVTQSVPPKRCVENASVFAVSVVAKPGSAVHALGPDHAEPRRRAGDPPPPWLS